MQIVSFKDQTEVVKQQTTGKEMGKNMRFYRGNKRQDTKSDKGQDGKGNKESAFVWTDDKTELLLKLKPIVSVIFRMVACMVCELHSQN